MIGFEEAGWLLALAAFAAVALAVVTLVLLWEAFRLWRKQRAVTGELRRISERAAAPGVHPDSGLLREEHEPDGLLLKLPHRRDLQHLLEQADSSWSVGTFLLLTVGLAVAAGVSVSVVSRGAPIPLGAAAAAALIPYLIVRRKRSKRFAAFEEQFPEAIDLLGRAIRAGHAFSTGLRVVTEESNQPLAGEFRQVFEEQKFGLPLRESLMGLADRIALVDVRIFVTAILIQRDAGGNLAEILDNLSYIIRERFKFQRQLKAETAQGRLTGRILMVMPIVAALAMSAVMPGYMDAMLEETTGRFMLGAAGVCQVMGFLVIRRIIDIEF